MLNNTSLSFTYNNLYIFLQVYVIIQFQDFIDIFSDLQGFAHKWHILLTFPVYLL